MKNGNGRRTPAAPEKPASDRVIRCAIYTRKSTEEGLQQDFSSLDAQREAGEAFVASQRNEGWQLVPERFDDGGFTGGNMDRPALQRAAVLLVVDGIVLQKGRPVSDTWGEPLAFR
jgi:site-specific DNA recombinase